MVDAVGEQAGVRAVEDNELRGMVLLGHAVGSKMLVLVCAQCWCWCVHNAGAGVRTMLVLVCAHVDGMALRILAAACQWCFACAAHDALVCR